MAVGFENLWFLEMKMTEHESIASFERTEVSNGVVYRIARMGGQRGLNVFYSGANEFGSAEYLARPSSIGGGDMILIEPRARLRGEVDELSRSDGILIARHEEFLRALNYKDIPESEPQWRWRKAE